jgi:hypothetical protein
MYLKQKDDFSRISFFITLLQVKVGFPEVEVNSSLYTQIISLPALPAGTSTMF